MGSVWLAEHLSLRTQRAIKFLSPECAASPEALERFKREATAAAQIHSPHVVQTFDHGLTSDGLPYIVLELLEGEDLDVRLEREHRLPLPLVVRIVTQVSKALDKAHAQSIVHRDIKPDNLFLVDVDGEPFIKVLDFGIAKKTDEQVSKMTATKAIIGTPHYMSPEQVLSSRDVDPRADLWSLSVVAYLALTGHVPFDGETVGAICVAIDRAEYVLPSKLRPDLPPSMDAWFARAFARNIDDRFQSARELADSFAAAAAGEETWGALPAAWTFHDSSSPPPLDEPPTSAALPLRPRWPWLAGAFAAMVAVAGVLVAWRAPSSTSAAPASRLVASISLNAMPPAFAAPAPSPPPIAPSASAAPLAPPAASSAPATPAQDDATSERSSTSKRPRYVAPPPRPRVDRGF